MLKYVIFTVTIFSLQFISAQCENFDMTISFMNPTCPGYSDGSITVSQTGANGLVNGEITNSTGQIVLNGGMGTSPNTLPAGWYYIYLIDDLGCELYDSVYIADPDELEVILDITLPTSLSACDGIAEVDTVLFYGGDFANLSYFWFPGGPSGIGQITKSDLCYGDYSLVVNNDVGCSTTIDFTVGSLSVDEDHTTVGYLLFPNPFSETTSFVIDPAYTGETLVIYNQLGQVIWSEVITSEITTLTSENLTSGVYFFTISDINGKMVVE